MKQGFGIIEIIFAIALISISLFALMHASNTAFVLVDENAREKKAVFILEEGVETVRILRDVSWSKNIAPLVNATPHYLTLNTPWGLTTVNPGPIDGVFDRTIVFEEVYRKDSDDDIVDQGAADPKTLDPNTRKVTVSVTWNASSGGQKTRTITTYISNLFSN